MDTSRGGKMKKAYFQYYETFENIAQKITDEKARAAFRVKVINYGLYGTLPTIENDIEDMAFEIIKDLIDQQVHRREMNRANRARREQIKAEQTQEEKPSEPKAESKPKTAKFEKPTVEEVRAYAKEKSWNVDAEKFCAYYEANGWRVGKNTMKNWKAAVQNWAHNGYDGRRAGTIWNDNTTDADTEKYEEMF